MRGRKPDYESLLRGKEAMSIHTWNAGWIRTNVSIPPATEFVTYADHVAAVAEAEQRAHRRPASYFQGRADERARIKAAVEAAWDKGFAPVMNYGFDGDPKPYPLEGHCYECHGEQYGADAAMDVVLAIIDGEQA